MMSKITWAAVASSAAVKGPSSVVALNEAGGHSAVPVEAVPVVKTFDGAALLGLFDDAATSFEPVGSGSLKGGQDD